MVVSRRQRAILPFGGFSTRVDNIEKSIAIANVPAGAGERAVFDHFCKCGTVSDVQILKNRLGAPTGAAILEFVEDEAVQRACNLVEGQDILLGVKLEVKPAHVVPKTTTTAAPPPKRVLSRAQFTQQLLNAYQGQTPAMLIPDGVSPTAKKLHITNLRPVVTEEDMRGIFKPFGEIENLSMGTKECWITFKEVSDARDAMSSMQGFQLVGQELQIALLSDVPPPAPAQPQEKLDIKDDTDFGAVGNAGSNLQSRIELMQKLLGTSSSPMPTVIGANGMPVGAGTSAPQTGGPASRTLMLQNMFTPSEVDLERDPRFYEDMREAACNSLNGRWFEGKKIAAQTVDDAIWQALATSQQVAAAT
jgi:hypothetical protein